jgi:hypothetical protein
MKYFLTISSLILILSGCNFFEKKTSYVCEIETSTKITSHGKEKPYYGDKKKITLVIDENSKNYQINEDFDLSELGSKFMRLTKSNDVENIYDYDNESDKDLQKYERHRNWLKINKVSGDIEIWVNHIIDGHMENDKFIKIQEFDIYSYTGQCKKIKN